MTGPGTDTDIDQLTAMLTRAGIPYEESAVPGGFPPYVKCISLVVNLPDEGPLVGYLGFATDFQFDAEGILRRIGIWE